MENAIDAGATSIEVVVEDAGRTCIQVIDNGKGMSETDARMAFERHATSKIREASDLFSLQTMGFRGEALPSIAAVSQVTMTTRTESQELGLQLTVEGSKITHHELCSCPVGANFQVRNLFYNVPARRKFLKSNKTELNNIIQEFERIALVNTSVTFSLMSGSTRMFRLPAASLLQRVVAVAGKKFNDWLLPISVETSLINISGFVGKPESSRKKNIQQYFFVNGRYMRHGVFHKAVQDSYNHLIPEGEQVPYFIYFEVNPAQIDVNIHPTKTEIKFENESSIYQIIVAAVRETLGRFNAVPTIDFDVEGRPEIPAFNGADFKGAKPPRINYDPHYNPFQTVGTNSRREGMNRKGPSTAHWQALYDTLLEKKDDKEASSLEGEATADLFQREQGSDVLAPSVEASSQLFQYRGQYILTAVNSGLMIIDQRRAHVRVLYDRYMQQMQGQQASTQGLLFPQLLQLSLSEAHLLESVMPDVLHLGFELTSLGGGSFSLNGVPPSLENADPVKILTDMIQEVAQGSGVAEREIRHRMALVMARNSAVETGQVLTQDQMLSLVNDLLVSENPRYTPTGKTTVTIISQDQIDRLFG